MKGPRCSRGPTPLTCSNLAPRPPRFPPAHEQAAAEADEDRFFRHTLSMKASKSGGGPVLQRYRAPAPLLPAAQRQRRPQAACRPTNPAWRAAPAAHPCPASSLFCPPTAPLPAAGDFRVAQSYDFETAVSPRAAYHVRDEPFRFSSSSDKGGSSVWQPTAAEEEEGQEDLLVSGVWGVGWEHQGAAATAVPCSAAWHVLCMPAATHLPQLHASAAKRAMCGWGVCWQAAVASRVACECG